MSKNDYIQNKSLKTFFIASVLISVINQVNSMVDGIIVSHFVSPDALSTVGLATPVLSVIYMLAGMISMGASLLVTKEIGIGGVMLGEYDIDGYRSLVVGLLKKCSIALAVFTVIFMVSPELLARTFGATDEMLPVVSPSLRVFCLSILPLGLISLLSSTYLLQGHKALAAVIQLLFVICILPPVWFTTVYCPEYLWHALPFGFWLMLVI